MLVFREIDTFLAVIECHLQFVWVWVDTIAFYMGLHNREVRDFAFFSIFAGTIFAPAFGAAIKNKRYMHRLRQ